MALRIILYGDHVLDRNQRGKPHGSSPGKGLKMDPDMKPVLEVLISDSEASRRGHGAHHDRSFGHQTWGDPLVNVEKT